MTKTELLSKVSRTFHKVGFQLKKHSPELLIVAGTVGVVTSTVMACKASTKLSAVLDESKNAMEQIKAAPNNPELADKYSEEDAKKDLNIVRTQTGLKLVKLYGPAVALGVASLGCFYVAHGIVHKRNLALTAAYAAVHKDFKEYRGRVIERFGKEMDKELKYNIKKKEIEETVVDENGNETTVKKTVDVVDVPRVDSPYARFYDDGCTGWTKDPEHNLFFLLSQQEYANQKLKAQGYLYLNEVYEMLGIPKSKAGHVVGWIYNEKNPVGDNYVDFGIHDVHKPANRDFVNGYERTILLDFNVDGNIWQLMA